MLGRHLFRFMALAAVSGCTASSADLMGDGFDCAEMDCSDRLEIIIERSDGQSFGSGEYEFVFSPSSGGQIGLECVLDNGNALDCTGGDESLSFDIQDSSSQFLAVFHFAPPSITVEVEFDGEQIGLETLNPSYSIVTPNGPECEPTCMQCSVVVKVLDTQ